MIWSLVQAIPDNVAIGRRLFHSCNKGVRYRCCVFQPIPLVCETDVSEISGFRYKSLYKLCNLRPPLAFRTAFYLRKR
jgi:hypothetical protein